MILPEKIQLKEEQLHQLYTELNRLIDISMVSHKAEYEALCAARLGRESTLDLFRSLSFRT